mgnify:CR=1 FL=1
MKIVIVHLGSVSQLIPVNSLISGIKKQKVYTDITIVTAEECQYIFKYNENINKENIKQSKRNT